MSSGERWSRPPLRPFERSLTLMSNADTTCPCGPSCCNEDELPRRLRRLIYNGGLLGPPPEVHWGEAPSFPHTSRRWWAHGACPWRPSAAARRGDPWRRPGGAGGDQRPVAGRARRWPGSTVGGHGRAGCLGGASGTAGHDPERAGSTERCASRGPWTCCRPRARSPGSGISGSTAWSPRPLERRHFTIPELVPSFPLGRLFAIRRDRAACLRARLGPRLVHIPSEPSGSQRSPAVRRPPSSQVGSCGYKAWCRTLIRMRSQVQDLAYRWGRAARCTCTSARGETTRQYECGRPRTR
jgi:hypothetical protein